VLILLALGCATLFGVSGAAASPRYAAATIHKISACGYVASKAGTYSLTKSIKDSGDGSCITLDASNVTLNLNSHTITGSGSDACIDVEGGSSSAYSNEVIVGGTQAKPTRRNKHPKPPKPATLTNCERGVNVNSTIGTKASYLTIVAPADFGVFANTAHRMTLSNIDVPLKANDASGFYLEHGAKNVVTHSTVGNNGAEDSFYALLETGDTFSYDTARITRGNADSDGVGFHEYECSRDTYSHDTVSGQRNGFDFDESGFGTVTATYNSAKGPHDIANSTGFLANEAYVATGQPSSLHSVFSHNSATGFQDDFYDTTPDRPSAVAETWTDNTAGKYTEYGFYIYFPIKFTVTGNIADANPTGKKYAGGTTDGFYFDNTSATQRFAKFAKNEAYDSAYGYYSNGDVLHGQGNIAKRNKHNFHDVANTR
jgi:hypothetical protein